MSSYGVRNAQGARRLVRLVSVLFGKMNVAVPHGHDESPGEPGGGTKLPDRSASQAVAATMAARYLTR